MEKRKKRISERAKRATTLAVSAITALLKLAAGAASASVFVIMSGLYSVGTGVAKAMCFKGSDMPASESAQAMYFAIAGTLAVAAVFYLACAIQQFFVPASFNLGSIPAIAVAGAAFYDLFSATAGLIRAVRAEDGFRAALKRINLSGAFAAIALTQVALLSVNSDGENAYANAALAVFAGAVTLFNAAAIALIGIRESKKKGKDGEDGERTASCR